MRLPYYDFHPTRWTLVHRSHGKGEDAKMAISELCAAYYEPVVSFLERDGRNEGAARDMAHAFFESVLTGGFGLSIPARGRFRNHLLGALKQFLAESRDTTLAGCVGGMEHVPLVTESDASPYPPMSDVTDDALVFDHTWALTLIARALTALEAEYAHKQSLFLALKPWLDGGATGSQAETARILDMSETAVRVAIHRLRARFRELIRAEVMATVSDPEEVTEELRHLIAVASRC